MPWGDPKVVIEIKDTTCTPLSDLSVLKALPPEQRQGPVLLALTQDRASLADCIVKHDYQKEVGKKLNGDS